MKKTYLAGLLAAAALSLFAVACGGASAQDIPTSATPKATATQEAISTPLPPATATVAPAQTNPAQIASPPSAPLPVATPAPADQGSSSSGTLPPCCKPTVAPPSSTLPATPPSLPAGTQAVAAPIDKLDIVVRESFPPQYVAAVKAGLPGGCAKQYASSVSRNGDTFNVVVQNSMPTGNVACTMIYGMYDVSLTLPAPFVSGVTYTVVANGAKTTTFTAQ